MALHSFVDKIPNTLPNWESGDNNNNNSNNNNNNNLRTLFLVFPLVERTLKNEMTLKSQEGKGFTEVEVLSILSQLMLLVLDLNVDHKIVHRDLKPDNIFIKYIIEFPYYQVMIGDFGEAWLADKNIQT